MRKKRLPFKVDRILGAAELEEFESVAKKPGCTVDAAKLWLFERGHRLSRSAVWRWQRHLRGFDRLGHAEVIHRVIQELEGLVDRLRRMVPDPLGCNGERPGEAAPAQASQEAA